MLYCIVNCFCVNYTYLGKLYRPVAVQVYLHHQVVELVLGRVLTNQKRVLVTIGQSEDSIT